MPELSEKATKVVPLGTILFAIFTNQDAHFKLPEHLWAVTEALNRVCLSRYPLWDWDLVEARNEYKCGSRGCTIKPGEKYYRQSKYVPDRDKGFKYCLRCETILWREKDGSWSNWRIRNANKDHKCSRGCAINTGDFYFICSGEKSDGMKMCARCMAMVLYFKGVDRLPAYRYIGWDQQRQEPASVGKPLLTGILGSYWFGTPIKG